MTEELNPLPTQGIDPIYELATKLKERASATLLGADIFVCDICGAVIADVMKHAMWHEALNTHLHQATSSMVVKESIVLHRHLRPEYRAPSAGLDGTDVFEKPIAVVTDVPPQYPTIPLAPIFFGKRL